MRIKALKSFAGKISMYAGEVREVVEEAIARDLIRAGHAVEVKAEKPVEKPVEKKPTKKKK